MATDDPYFVSALAKGLEVLRTFTADTPSLSLGELAERLGWPRSGPFRFTYTLERLGYLRRDPKTKRYALTTKVLDFGYEYLRALPVTELARPPLEDLSAETYGSTHLVVLDGKDALYISHVPTRIDVSTVVTVGSRIPAHATAAGLALLAQLGDSEIEGLLGGEPLARFTERTLTDREELNSELQRVRAQGYAFSDQCHYRGIRAVAAPVYDSSGTAQYAVNTSALVQVFDDRHIRDVVVPAVRKTADILSRALGYR